MPTNLTDGSVWVNQVQVPSDGDPRTASGFLRTAFQNLADRTAVLANIVGVTGISGTGIKRVQTVLTTTALKNLAAADGDFAFLLGTKGASIYRFMAGVTASDVANKQYGTSLANPGTWYIHNFDLIGAANGIASLDAAARAQQLPLYGNVKLRSNSYTGGGINITGAAGWQDFPAGTPVVDFTGDGAQANDLLIIWGAVQFNATAGTCQATLSVVDNAVTTQLAASTTTIAVGTTDVGCGFLSVYTVTNGTGLKAKFQGNTNGGGGTLNMQAPASIAALLLRP